MKTERLTVDDVRSLLEESTQSLPGALIPSTDLKALDGWDSMGMVMFMGLVHEKSGLELSVHDLRGCTTVDELACLIAGRQKA